MADCYQKLGESAEAASTYEQLVREFGDQTAAASEARTLLAGLTGVNTPLQVDRQLWTGIDVDLTGAVSNDGRTLSYTDWETAELVLRDLRSGSERRLSGKLSSKEANGLPYRSVLSHDGARVAIQWEGPDSAVPSLRLLDIRRGGAPSATVLYENADIEWMEPLDWSPDGKWIAVQFNQNNSGNIGLVSVEDGTLRRLHSLDWRGTTTIAFSPDGRFLAYDLPAGPADVQRDVFLLSVDANTQAAAVTHPANDVVVGWSPDGGSLIFASDRSGTMGLFAVSVVGGKPAGRPSALKADVGRFIASLGVTSAGTLVYGVQTSAHTVSIADVDFTTGRLLSPPRELTEAFLFGHKEPSWSPDGRQLLFLSERPRGMKALSILSVETDRLRQLSPQLSNFSRPSWTPDGSISAVGQDSRGRQGLYRIDPESGQASLIVGRVGPTYFWSTDGAHVYYRANNAAVTERHVASGLERVLEVGRTFSPSPDQQQIAYFERDGTSRRVSLFIKPLAGGTPRAVHQFGAGEEPLGFLRWTPDGQRLLFGRWVGEDLIAWSIPATGGLPAAIDPRIEGNLSQISVHPDGRRIVFESGEGRVEVRSLERFLPAAASSGP